MMKRLLTIVIILQCKFGAIFMQANNVCLNWNDYHLRRDNCYYNAEQHLEAWQIIERRGYKTEKHYVTTDDGYKLMVLRILSGNNNGAAPVLLAHGLYLSCMGFITMGNNSLAFRLANAGFDVWLANFRGSRYSNTHRSLSTDDRLYWDFSFNEIGAYDVKSFVDLIYEKTQQRAIYIGYSMGTTASYVYASKYPTLAVRKLKVIVSLAPVAYVDNARGSVGKLAHLWPFIESGAATKMRGVIMQRTPETIASIKSMCLDEPQKMLFCLSATQSIFGYDWEEVNYEYYPVYSVQNADAISTKMISHYDQGVLSKDFRQFDHGMIGNLQKYNRFRPPSYDLAHIRVPVKLIHGLNDLLAMPKDVDRLHRSLPSFVRLDKYLVPYKQFSHADFLNAKNVGKLLYDYVVEFCLHYK